VRCVSVVTHDLTEIIGSYKTADTVVRVTSCLFLLIAIFRTSDIRGTRIRKHFADVDADAIFDVFVDADIS